MNYLVATLLLGSIAGGEHFNWNATGLPSACNLITHDVTHFDAVDVLVVLDQHGGYVAIRACPSRAFSIDFSHGHLHDRRYRSLLNRLTANSLMGLASTEMRVSGTIRRAAGAEVRDTMEVTRIISYRLR